MRDERRGDLLDGCLATVIAHHVTCETGGILDRTGANRIGICSGLRADEFVRNRRERLRCVVELHRVAFLHAEVDEHLAREQVPLRDAAESPALVLAIRARLQLLQLPCRFRRQLPSFYDFLQFLVH